MKLSQHEMFPYLFPPLEKRDRSKEIQCSLNTYSVLAFYSLSRSGRAADARKGFLQVW